MTPQQALSLYAEENPFASADAYRYSNYSASMDDGLVRLLDWRACDPRAQLAHNAMRTFVLSDRFSCVAAKAALQTNGYRFGHYPRLHDEALEGLARDLCAFSAEFPSMSARYRTFIATFGGQAPQDEAAFERWLWETLQRLHDLDVTYHGWDERVSDDPQNARFSFSFSGRAFFVVGLHPASSRLSRRFAMPALAFNAHEQFDELRESALFERVSARVREKELALQGTLNPNLAGYGDESEARQYSGREVEATWRCPFQRR